MEWQKFLETALGPLLGSFLGAAAALSSLWIKEWFDRRRNAQEWFEREYVNGAINPIVDHLQRWIYMLVHLESQAHLEVSFANLPHSEIVRLQTVLRSNCFETRFYVIASAIYDAPTAPAEFRHCIDYGPVTSEMAYLRDTLLELQRVLLTVRVTDKAAVGLIANKWEVQALRQCLDSHVPAWKPGQYVPLTDEAKEFHEALQDFEGFPKELDSLSRRDDLSEKDLADISRRLGTVVERLNKAGASCFDFTTPIPWRPIGPWIGHESSQEKPTSPTP